MRLKNLFLVASLFYFLNCSFPTTKSTEPPIVTPKPQIAENVSILSNYSSQKICSIGENQIVLSEATNETNLLYPGAIIVCNVTSATPKGLLRKIMSVSEDKKTFTTSCASIEELVDNYSLNLTKSLVPSQVTYSNITKGITPDITKGFDFNYKLTNVVLFDLDGNNSTKGDQITANGPFSFNSTFDFGFDIKGFKLKSFKLKNITNENVDVKINSPIAISNLDQTVKISEYDFVPLTIYIPTDPPIPIIINPKLEVYVGIKGEITRLSAKLNQNANLSIGISYDGEWNPTFDFSNTFQFEQPEIPKTMEYYLFAEGKLSTCIYDFFGTYSSAEEYTTFKSWIEGTDMYWKIMGGLKGNVGVNMKIFGNSIFDYRATPIDFSKQLANGNTPLPVQEITIQPTPEEVDDAYVHLDKSGSTEHYSGSGTSPFLNVDKYVISNNGWLDESLIKFPIDKIPSNATITSAKLCLYGLGAMLQETALVTAREILTPWEESTVKYNAKPTYGNIVTAENLSSSTKWWEWNITPLVQRWVNGQQANYGVAFTTLNNRPDNTFNDGFRSSDSLETTHRPKLIITYSTN